MNNTDFKIILVYPKCSIKTNEKLMRAASHFIVGFHKVKVQASHWARMRVIENTNYGLTDKN